VLKTSLSGLASARWPARRGLELKKRLFVFDMDGTLLPNTTACLELARETGTATQLHALESDFVAGRIDTKGFAAAISMLWGALAPEVILGTFAKSPKLRNIREVTRAVAEGGGRSCLISMSPDFFTEYFRDFGFDFVYSSRFPRNGEPLDPDHILVPDDKPRLVRELCASESLVFEDTVAFGDSMSDYPLFRCLRLTVGVNPDQKLEKLALATYRGDDLYGAYSAITNHF
jgi:phosphoserine phosphatase